MSRLICIVFQGLYLEIYGPTLIDLKLKIGADYEQIATAISGRGVGVFVGCVVWGILVDKFLHWSHVFIAIALGIAAIVTVVAPWSPNVELLYLWCAVGGFAEVAIGIGKQRKYIQDRRQSKTLILSTIIETVFKCYLSPPFWRQTHRPTRLV